MFPYIQIITTDVTTAQLNLERSRVSERNRLFLTYSKQWWREFLQVRTTHSNRLVKIFAQDETSTHRLVCSYVRPLKAGRLLDTPRQAARYGNFKNFAPKSVFLINPLSSSVALIETSQLISTASQLTCFYMRVALTLNGLMSNKDDLILVYHNLLCIFVRGFFIYFLSCGNLASF